MTVPSKNLKEIDFQKKYVKKESANILGSIDLSKYIKESEWNNIFKQNSVIKLDNEPYSFVWFDGEYLDKMAYSFKYFNLHSKKARLFLKYIIIASNEDLFSTVDHGNLSDLLKTLPRYIEYPDKDIYFNLLQINENCRKMQEIIHSIDLFIDELSFSPDDFVPGTVIYISDDDVLVDAEHYNEYVYNKNYSNKRNT